VASMTAPSVWPSEGLPGSVVACKTNWPPGARALVVTMEACSFQPRWAAAAASGSDRHVRAAIRIPPRALPARVAPDVANEPCDHGGALGEPHAALPGTAACKSSHRLEGDVLGLHGGIDRDPRQILRPKRPALVRHPQALGQENFQLAAEALGPMARNFFGGKIPAPDAQAIFCRLRNQARRPPLAKIRPGRPAPTMGPGTLCRCLRQGKSVLAVESQHAAHR
jgi:hypothetical protein